MFGTHKSQIFSYFLTSLLIGVLIASIFDVTFSVGLVGFLVVLFILGMFFQARKNFENGAKLVFIIIFCFIFLILGGLRFVYFSQNESFFSQYFNLFEEGNSLRVNAGGYVFGEPEISGAYSRFVFKVKKIEAGGQIIEGEEKVLVTVRRFPEYKIGQILELEGELKVPENFDDFDYRTYLKKDGINLVMAFPNIKEGKGLELGPFDKLRLNFYRGIFSIKNKFQNSINLSISEPNASFINGILLGTRQNIPENLKEDFRTTGTSHILAISGYNITIVAEAMLYGLILFMRRRKAFWFSVGAIIVFTVLTGASASVVRAAIMGLLVLFANGYGRLYDPKNSIILAAAIMVLFNPMTLIFDVGFQLSFAAVIGLIYLYPWLEGKLYKIKDQFGLKELVLMTVSAQIAVAPLIIYYFGNMSLVSLPTNILILPFTPFAMLFGFVSGLTGMIYQPLGQAIGYIAWAITTYQIEVVKYFSSVII